MNVPAGWVCNDCGCYLPWGGWCARCREDDELAENPRRAEPVTDVLVVPDPISLTIGVAPDLAGDVVVERFVDARTGTTYVVARDPESARELATLLETAATSPRIGAVADQLRAEQRNHDV